MKNSLPIYIVHYNINFIVGIIAKKYLKYTADKRKILKLAELFFKHLEYTKKSIQWSR